MTAIVTDAHYRMSLALIRDLADAGVSVIACDYVDIKNPVGFFSCKLSKSVTLTRESGEAELYALCKRVFEQTGQKPALMPVGAQTLEIVSRSQEYFENVCGLLVPTLQQLELFNDKSRVGALAKTLGIPVPREYDISDSLSFPVVVKPVCGEKFGLHAESRYVIARDMAQLERAVRRFTDITGSAPIIQEYLSGGGAGCSVLAHNGIVTAHVCHKRIREYPVSGGPSSCCIKIEAPRLLEYAEKMVAECGYSGVAMFEFKSDANGEYRLLEINPRVWGTYPLTRACGSNFSYLWYLSSLGLLLPPFDGGKPVKMVYYPSDFAAMLEYLRRGKIGAFFSGLADFLNPFVKNGLNEKGDRKPYQVYIKSLFERGRK